MRIRHLALAAIWLSLAHARAETLLVLEDFEGSTRPWRGGQLVQKPVRGGKGALKWEVAKRHSLDSLSFLVDLTDFDELRFWAYSEKNWGFKIPLVFPSDGGYYIVDWTVDWQGWREHRIKLADCKAAYRPAGWHHIRSIGFRAQGYGQGPVPKGLTIVFDDFALHSPKDLPHTSMEERMVEKRRQHAKELKARGNPYYAAVLESLKNAAAKPALADDFDSCWQFRTLAEKALNAAWAAGFGDSPRKGDKTLVSNASAIIDFCLKRQKEGSWFYSRKWRAGDPNCDRFTLGPLMDAIWWLRRLPNMQGAWKRWEAPLKEAVDFQYVHWGSYKERGFRNNVAWGASACVYPNQDVFHLFEMLLAHRWWGDKKYRESAEKALAGLQAQLLPDGGWRYIGPETECPVYHNLVLVWLARCLDLTADERIRDMILKTRNYYPLTYSNEGFPESYTDCWWKHYWSGGSPSGPEIVAGLTGDPQHKWLANRLLERVGPRGNYGTIYAGMYYRDSIEEKPLPDNWLKLDRNIGGPRGRFGKWYFAGVTGGGARDTFVGAMISDPKTLRPLNGALLAANIEVALNGNGRRRQTRLYLSGPDDITAVKIHGDTAALGVRYTLRKPYINSQFHPDVPATPWQATQVWLFTRHALVGLVEIAANKEKSTVSHIQGQLRFGPDLPLTRDDEGVFHCGALALRLLGHTFATVHSGRAQPGYARQSTSHSAVTLRTAGAQFAAKPGQPLWYAAAIAPEWAPEVSAFQRSHDQDKHGFSVEIAGRVLSVAFMPSKRSISIRAK